LKAYEGKWDQGAEEVDTYPKILPG